MSPFSAPYRTQHSSFPPACPSFKIMYLFNPQSPVSAAQMSMDMGSSTGYVGTTNGHIPKGK